MIKKTLIFTVIFIVTGCTSSYRHSVLQAPFSKLDPNLGVLVSVPEDGWYESRQYRNSGQMTANVIRAAFAKEAQRVDFAKNCQGETCLDNVDTEKYGYFIKPVILHWEDRATEWSGKPDRIEIQLVIYDTATRIELANISYTGKSKWMTLGGDHPQDLLVKPTNAYVSSLYK